MSHPLSLEEVVAECYKTVAKEGGGLRMFLEWRQWRAEWLGKLEACKWEADNRDGAYAMWLRHGPSPGSTALPPRPLDAIMHDLQEAVAMVALLGDCSDIVKEKVKAKK